MTISANQPTPATTNAPARMDNKTLDTACQEFEGMLLGSILKQGDSYSGSFSFKQELTHFFFTALHNNFAGQYTAFQHSEIWIESLSETLKYSKTRAKKC